MAQIQTLATVSQMMQEGKHLTPAGLRYIVDLVFATPLKKGGDRRYTKAQLMQIIKEHSSK